MNIDELSTLGIPDSKLARDVTQFIRDTEGDLLFHHSARDVVLQNLSVERLNAERHLRLLVDEDDLAVLWGQNLELVGHRVFPSR